MDRKYLRKLAKEVRKELRKAEDLLAAGEVMKAYIAWETAQDLCADGKNFVSGS